MALVPCALSIVAFFARIWLLMRKVILALAFAIHICGAAMQAAAKRICISQLNLDHVHAQLVHLLSLIDLRFFNADGFWIKDQNIHAEPG